MTSRTSRWLWALALAAALLTVAGSAQARQKDDGDVIVCKSLASCLADIPQPGGDGDLTGTDASSLGSVVNDDGGDDADSSSGDTAPSAAVTGPQVVTTPTQPASGAATAKPGNTAQVPSEPPYCSNHPEFGQNPPQGWVKDSASGTCSYDVCPNLDGVQSNPPDGMYRNDSGDCVEKRGPDAIGMCDPEGGYHLFRKDQVPGMLTQKYVMAIVVDGVGLVCLISDVTTFHANPADYVDSKTYVEGGDTHFPIYACQTPFGDETVPFYRYYVQKGTVVTPTAKEEPGCPTAASNLSYQTRLTVQKHGLLWGGHHYGTTSVFAKVLRRQGGTWRGWKKNHPALARGLAEHGAAYKRHKK